MIQDTPFGSAGSGGYPFGIVTVRIMTLSGMVHSGNQRSGERHGALQIFFVHFLFPILLLQHGTTRTITQMNTWSKIKLYLANATTITFKIVLHSRLSTEICNLGLSDLKSDDEIGHRLNDKMIKTTRSDSYLYLIQLKQ